MAEGSATLMQASQAASSCMGPLFIFAFQLVAKRRGGLFGFVLCATNGVSGSHSQVANVCTQASIHLASSVA